MSSRQLYSNRLWAQPRATKPKDKMNSAQNEFANVAEYDGQNFSLWKLGLWVLLEQHGLIEVVTGEEPIPPRVTEGETLVNGEAIQNWKDKDVKARRYILRTTKLSEQHVLVACTTANQMWTTLSAQHLERATDNLFDLQARFYQYSYDASSNMKTHIAKIQTIAHHLGEVGRPVEERELITKVVCTLPEPYRSFVSSWRHVPADKQTMTTLTSLLLQEEREIAKWTPKTSSSQELALHAQPLSGTPGHRSGLNKRGGRGSNQSNHDRKFQNSQSNHQGGRQNDGCQKHCTYCGLNNHNIESCNYKRRHERTDQERAEFAKRMRKENAQMGVVSEGTEAPQRTHDYSLVSTNPRFQTRSTGDWFADSGATQHMSDQRDWLSDFVTVPEGPGPFRELDHPVVQ